MKRRVSCGFMLLCATALYGQSADEPKLFAGGMISPLGPTNLTFSPDGKIVYFVQHRCQIMTSRFQGGQWSAPAPMEFSGPYRDGDPFLSPDGSQLFFWSTRPLNGKQRRGPALWAAGKTDAGWSEPRDLGVTINGPDGGTGFPSVAANGTLYFMATRPDSLGGLDIYRARRVGDGYAEPENLGPAINSPQNDLDAYIAPDESFIVFDSHRPGGLGQGDLYISTRKNGGWTPPRNLGPSINSAGGECCPAVSRDGKYFFFTTGRSGISRVPIAALGLERPAPAGLAAETFADGTISAPGSFSITFSPDGKTAYFAEAGASIVASHLQDGKWTAAAPLESSSRQTDLNPFLSPDGSRLFFSSPSRPRTGQQKTSLGLWVAEKTAAGWSAPQDLGAAINGPDGTASASVAANGTLYFIARRPDSLGSVDIYRARRAGNGYAAPENLGPSINSPQGEFDVYVAPDESFIVFSSDRPGGLGRSDFYISSFKNGAWTPPRNLGPKINTTGPECCPSVSPDGKYFYFNRLGGGQPGIYQVGIAALGLEQK